MFAFSLALVALAAFVVGVGLVLLFTLSFASGLMLVLCGLCGWRGGWREGAVLCVVCWSL